MESLRGERIFHAVIDRRVEGIFCWEILGYNLYNELDEKKPVARFLIRLGWGRVSGEKMRFWTWNTRYSSLLKFFNLYIRKDIKECPKKFAPKIWFGSQTIEKRNERICQVDNFIKKLCDSAAGWFFVRDMIDYAENTLTPEAEEIIPRPLTTSNANMMISGFPKYGVKPAYVIEFQKQLKSIIGSDEKFTTNDACELYVKPMTRDEQCSMVDLLLKDHSPYVGEATIFVSHAWRSLWVDFTTILEAHFHDIPVESQPYLWIDLFSNNQHYTEDRQFDWWINVFMNAIRRMHHTLIVFDDYSKPTPLSRAWCLWELYCSIITNSRIEITLNTGSNAGSNSKFTLPNLNKKKFMALPSIKQKDQYVLSELCNQIDCRNSYCSIPNDQTMIHQAIEKQVGFERMNQLIKEAVMLNFRSVFSSIVYSNNWPILFPEPEETLSFVRTTSVLLVRSTKQNPYSLSCFEVPILQFSSVDGEPLNPGRVGGPVKPLFTISS